MKNDDLVLNSTTDTGSLESAAGGKTAVTIDCGVTEMTGKQLNDMMKTLRALGVTEFKLINVCGQDLIGTGLQGPAKIDVYGLMGNHSCAFVDGLVVNTHQTRFPNNVYCPGDAQVAIGNTSNPIEMNIGGHVDDLFAAYVPSGTFRVAGQGGNRCILRGGAGVPRVWRAIDYSRYENMTDAERIEEMLYLQQKRRAKIHEIGWSEFIKSFRDVLNQRSEPIVVFGRRVKDYFMEYAQGTVGILLNVYNVPSPIGYYVCSGMTAGKALIRGSISEGQMGHNVVQAAPDDADRALLCREIEEFYKRFSGKLHSNYNTALDGFYDRYNTDREGLLGEFVKIVPADSRGD